MKVLARALWVALAAAGCAPSDEGAPAPSGARPDGDHADAAGGERPQAAKPRKKPREYAYDSVPANHDLAIPSGFRGDVHPVLSPDASLELVARWKPTLPEAKRKGIKLGIIDNAVAPEYSIPDDLVALLTESQPAAERATYGARDLSVLLPAEIEGVGQTWAIDPDAAARFLRQLHPATATGFDRYHQPYGRRPGPAGAFGILRAVTPAHLDVLFRVHAEFVLREGMVVYTPACFLGRMLVDRAAGTVAYLDLRVPTDLAVNLNILLTFPIPDDPRMEVTNIVFERVETMELSGGDPAALARVEATDALALDDAHHRLKRAFYKFLDIEWVAPENAVETAAARKLPMLAAVLTSPLDDQSC